MSAPPLAYGQERRVLDHHATVLNGRLVGSAFEVSEGLAVTNAHVLEGLRPGASVKFIPSRPGGTIIRAPVVAISPRMDLAVLRVPRGSVRAVKEGRANGRTGATVTAAGVDAATVGSGNSRMQVSGRIVTPRVHIASFGPGLIARLPGARPGFSGGPLLDGNGRLVGMVTAIRPETAGRTAPRAASGFAPADRRPPAAQEAYVLRAAEIRAEVARLMRSRRR